MRRRVELGQRLWSPYDTGALEHSRDGGWVIGGDHDYGAICGLDESGHPHRYAIWTTINNPRATKPLELLYVPAFASFVDRFDQCPELYAIHRHARLSGASKVTVCPLFSARIRTERNLRTIADPATAYGLYWLRNLARHATRRIVCWGETPAFRRYKDALRILTSRMQKIYAVGDGEWPPMVTRVTESGMMRYELAADDELDGEEIDRYVPEFD